MTCSFCSGFFWSAGPESGVPDCEVSDVNGLVSSEPPSEPLSGKYTLVILFVSFIFLKLNNIFI